MAELVAHCHGKTGVKVLKVNRSSPRHTMHEYFCNIRLFAPSYDVHYTDGVNTDLIATDTVKNTVYVVAKTCPMENPEQLARAIVKFFLDKYSFVTGVTADVTEELWERARVGGVGHNHGFLRKGPQQGQAVAECFRGKGLTVTSTIKNLVVLKTTQSGFEGFHRNEHTLLPETRERIVATNVTATYRYADPGREYDFTSVRQGVTDALCDEFFGPPTTGVYSPSVQETLFKMGSAVLSRVSQVDSITLDMPNIHMIPAKFLDSLGSKFEDDVFMPTVYPHGAIMATVERSKGGAGVRRRATASACATTAADAATDGGAAAGAGVGADADVGARVPTVAAHEMSRL